MVIILLYASGELLAFLLRRLSVRFQLILLTFTNMHDKKIIIVFTKCRHIIICNKIVAQWCQILIEMTNTFWLTNPIVASRFKAMVRRVVIPTAGFVSGASLIANQTRLFVPDLHRVTRRSQYARWGGIRRYLNVTVATRCKQSSIIVTDTHAVSSRAQLGALCRGLVSESKAHIDITRVFAGH